MLGFKTQSGTTLPSGSADAQKHYINSAMQPIQVMQALLTHEQFCGFLIGNHIKYKMREKFKGQASADRDKARQYLYWYRLVSNDPQYRIVPTEDVPPENWSGTLIE